MVMQSFYFFCFFLGGGGGVNKVHYSLCENGECFACPWTYDILVDL